MMHETQKDLSLIRPSQQAGDRIYWAAYQVQLPVLSVMGTLVTRETVL